MFGHTGPSRAARLLGVAIVGAALLAGCGSSATPSPTSPTAAIASLPAQMPDPTTARDVYIALRQAGLSLVGTDTVGGLTPSDPVERINATLSGQPLSILGYASDLGRAKLYPYRDGTAPDGGQPVYTFAGSNIVVEFGQSTSGKKPPLPDATLGAVAQKLATTLQALLGQLSERSVQRASTPPPAATPTPAPVPATPVPSAS